MEKPFMPRVRLALRETCPQDSCLSQFNIIKPCLASKCRRHTAHLHVPPEATNLAQNECDLVGWNLKSWFHMVSLSALKRHVEATGILESNSSAKCKKPRCWNKGVWRCWVILVDWMCLYIFGDVLHCLIPHIKITSKDNKYNKIQHT